MASAAAEAGKTKRNVIGVREGCIGKGVRVAHFACSAQGGRVVRVALERHDDRMPVAYPRSMALEPCPVCEVDHRVGLMWRSLNQGEELRAEILVSDD